MKNLYITKDFYNAAMLIYNGFEIKSHYRENGFTSFVFENSDRLQKIVNQFYSMKAQVEPLKYSQAIRSLKGIIHSSVSTSNQINKNEFITKQEQYL